MVMGTGTRGPRVLPSGSALETSPVWTEGYPFLPAQSSSNWRKSSCSLLFAITFVPPWGEWQHLKQGGEAVVVLSSEGTDWGLPSAWRKGPEKMAASSGGSCAGLHFAQHSAILRECFLYFFLPPQFFLQVIYKQQGSPCFWFQFWQQQVLQPSTATVPCPALSPSLGLCWNVQYWDSLSMASISMLVVR